MDSQRMVNISHLPRRWRVATHRTSAKGGARGMERAPAPHCIEVQGAPAAAMSIAPCHSRATHLRTIRLGRIAAPMPEAPCKIPGGPTSTLAVLSSVPDDGPSLAHRHPAWCHRPTLSIRSPVQCQCQKSSPVSVSEVHLCQKRTSSYAAETPIPHLLASLVPLSVPGAHSLRERGLFSSETSSSVRMVLFCVKCALFCARGGI